MNFGVQITWCRINLTIEPYILVIIDAKFLFFWKEKWKKIFASEICLIWMLAKIRRQRRKGRVHENEGGSEWHGKAKREEVWLKESRKPRS